MRWALLVFQRNLFKFLSQTCFMNIGGREYLQPTNLPNTCFERLQRPFRRLYDPVHYFVPRPFPVRFVTKSCDQGFHSLVH